MEPMVLTNPPLPKPVCKEMTKSTQINDKDSTINIKAPCSGGSAKQADNISRLHGRLRSGDVHRSRSQGDVELEQEKRCQEEKILKTTKNTDNYIGVKINTINYIDVKKILTTILMSKPGLPMSKAKARPHCPPCTRVELRAVFDQLRSQARFDQCQSWRIYMFFANLSHFKPFTFFLSPHYFIVFICVHCPSSPVTCLPPR